MAQVKVGIIDDGYPSTQTLLTVDDINKLTPLEDEWGSEIDLRDLNIRLVGESFRWKRKIHVEAFKHPNFYFNKRDWNWDFLIFDWEYKPESNSVDYLRKTLSLTKCPIYIYTAYNKFDDIPNLLSTIQFSQFREKNRFQIFNKSEKHSEDTILDFILEKFQKGEDVLFENTPLTIKPSKHIIDSEDFWILKSLIGTENILSALKEKNSNIVDEDTILLMFEKSKYNFFIDKHKSILSASNNQLISEKFGELKSLSMIDALNIFGIEKLEETKERGYSKIK